ncbi:hypothetical protein niasHS_009021 [Heterodera schachtii]|uniref:Uncharacterized protein n=1 Tax=Heterodera schachtii TaxID=97005 RepID=A0ABD2J1M7_HETSC
MQQRIGLELHLFGNDTCIATCENDGIGNVAENEFGKGNEENGNKMKTAKADILADRMKLLLSNAKFADAHIFVGKYDEKELVPTQPLKFNVIGLFKVCADFPISQLSNVFAALSIGCFNDLLKDFVQQCLAYIDKNADALRWVDEKCCENGIECSAENRRQMLGPALFKIRFPLFSQEDFSEKIVPSDVLSKKELLAVYQFHSLPNRRRISDGFFSNAISD